MAITNKPKEWETKNSLYLIYAFFPLINCLAFFHMNSRVPNKKWKNMAWVTLFVNLFLILLTFLSSVFSYSIQIRPYPEQTYSYVNESKYFGSNYLTDEEKQTHPNYEEYSKAYEQYSQDKEDYENSAEYKEAKRVNNSFRDIMGVLGAAFIMVAIVFNIVILFLIISQRADYLRALANSENRGQMASRMSAPPQSRTPSAANIPPEISRDMRQMYAQPQQNVQPQPETVPLGKPDMLDINSASQEEIADLPGLTLIDAKKAVDYRNANGGFNSLDEFYNAINIKPHIMLRIEGMIFVGRVQHTDKSANTGRRTIDF